MKTKKTTQTQIYVSIMLTVALRVAWLLLPTYVKQNIAYVSASASASAYAYASASA